MLNRRTFFKGSTLAAAGAFTFAKSSNAQQQGVDPNVMNAAVSVHSIQNSNTYNGTLSSSDYQNIEAVHRNLLSDLQSKNLDPTFMNTISGVQASQISTNGLDLGGMLQQIQIYNPAYDMATLQQGLSVNPMDATSVSNALGLLQRDGLTGLYMRVIDMCGLILNPPQAAPDGVIANGTPQKPQQPPHRPGGGGGYNCTTDGTLILGLGTALTIVSIMAGPLGILSETAFWGAVGYYGGIAGTGWGLGHAKVCGIS